MSLSDVIHTKNVDDFLVRKQNESDGESEK